MVHYLENKNGNIYQNLVFVCVNCSVLSDSLQPHALQSARLLCPWNSHSLLQGIFPTQGSNPGLQHCRWILYHLSHHLPLCKRESLFFKNQTLKDLGVKVIMSTTYSQTVQEKIFGETEREKGRECILTSGGND